MQSRMAGSGAVRRPGATAGFTLVELMVALFMMAIGILAVGRLFVFAQGHASHGRTESMAVSLAQEIREKILSKNMNDLETMFDGVNTNVPETITTPCVEWAAHLDENLGPTGCGEISVLTPAEDYEIVDGMVTVIITITWEEDGHEKTAPMHFSLSRMGI